MVTAEEHKNKYTVKKMSKRVEPLYQTAIGAFDRLVIYHGYSFAGLDKVAKKVMQKTRCIATTYRYIIALEEARRKDKLIFRRDYDLAAHPAFKHLSMRERDEAKAKMTNAQINELSRLSELRKVYGAPFGGYLGEYAAGGDTAIIHAAIRTERESRVRQAAAKRRKQRNAAAKRAAEAARAANQTGGIRHATKQDRDYRRRRCRQSARQAQKRRAQRSSIRARQALYLHSSRPGERTGYANDSP